MSSIRHLISALLAVVALLILPGASAINSTINVTGKFAYSANAGWINFGWAAPGDANRPRVDLLAGGFSGFAYSANMGWINLGGGSLITDTMAIMDTDADGIADAWEMTRFANLTTATATSDADGDGANGLDGVRVVGSCRITENKCDGNGTASISGRGIHVITSNCTIQTNSMTGNDIGMFVESSPNSITGNSARANPGGNYNILAGNMTGTIQTSVAAMNAATNTYGNLSF